MAKKGDRGALEPLARRLYAEGRALSEISETLDVSVTSLALWKSESKVPSAEVDEWDRARQQKRSNLQRLRDLYDDQLAFTEGTKAVDRSSAMMDALAKVGSMLERWESTERAEMARRMEEEQTVDIDRPAIFLQTLEWMAGQLREIDPEGLKVLARNFDQLVIRFKSECAKSDK